MPRSGPGQLLTLVGYSSVFPKNHWIQAIYIKVEISLTTIVQPPIELRISMFDVCGKSNILEGSTFTCLQQTIVSENITKELIRNFWDKQSSVMIKNKT